MSENNFVSGTIFIKDEDEKYRHYGISFEKRLKDTGSFVTLSDGEEYYIEIFSISKELKEEIKKNEGITKSIHVLKSGKCLESEANFPIG